MFIRKTVFGTFSKSLLKIFTQIDSNKKALKTQRFFSFIRQEQLQ